MADLSSLLKMQEIYNRIHPKSVRDILAVKRRFSTASLVNENLVRSHIKSFSLGHSLIEHLSLGSAFIARETSISYQHRIAKTFLSLDGYSKEELASLTTGTDDLHALEFDLSETIEDEKAKSIYIDESKRVQRIITDIYHQKTELLALSSREFEEMISELLRNEGFQVELTKKTRDNGFDILALMKIENHPMPLKFLVECKRYTTAPVGVEVIRSFKEVIATENATRGIVATTSYFTKDAKKKREEAPYLLDYRDKNEVMAWVGRYCDDIFKEIITH
jgi:hypothetical protein